MREFGGKMPYNSANTRKRRPITFCLQLVVMASSLSAAALSGMTLLASADQEQPVLKSYKYYSALFTSARIDHDAGLPRTVLAADRVCDNKNAVVAGCSEPDNAPGAVSRGLLWPAFLLSLVSLFAGLTTAFIAFFPPSWIKKTQFYG